MDGGLELAREADVDPVPLLCGLGLGCLLVCCVVVLCCFFRSQKQSVGTRTLGSWPKSFLEMAEVLKNTDKRRVLQQEARLEAAYDEYVQSRSQVFLGRLWMEHANKLLVRRPPRRRRLPSISAGAIPPVPGAAPREKRREERRARRVGPSPSRLRARPSLVDVGYPYCYYPPPENLRLSESDVEVRLPLRESQLMMAGEEEEWDESESEQSTLEEVDEEEEDDDDEDPFDNQ